MMKIKVQAEKIKETLQDLSCREIQVLVGILSGLSVGEIAVRLNVNFRTVSTYRQRLLEKCDVMCGTELMAYAICHGFVLVEDIGLSNMAKFKKQAEEDRKRGFIKKDVRLDMLVAIA